MSFEKERKARILLREGKVKKDMETAKRIHFRVLGRSGEHSVIYDKEKRKWLCDCTYMSLHGEYCSHVLACQMYLEKAKEKLSL